MHMKTVMMKRILWVCLMQVWVISHAFSQTQEELDSLISSNLPFFEERARHAGRPFDRVAVDTLLAKIVPSVDIETVEDRMACLNLDMPITINKTVCGFIHFFTVRKRNYTQTMLERKNYYFPIFEYYLQKHQMPDALKYLSIVESGLNFKAKSRTGALGLWQFMPGTGKDFYLSQDHLLDERQNPYLATEAACKFLKYLNGMFNDWELALAAYNCGPGNVLKAMRKSGKRKFWDIYDFLPQETRSYVPQFHAVVYSMNFAHEHFIEPDLDSVLVAQPLDTFLIEKSIDLNKLESILGLPQNALHQHNPVARTPIFPGKTNYPLLVPSSHGPILSANLTRFIDSAAVTISSAPKSHGNHYHVYKAHAGEKPTAVASKFGLALSDLQAYNRLPHKHFKGGERIKIPLKQNPASQLASTPSNVAKAQPEPAADAIEHRVQKGEKLYQVAVRYGLTTNQLKAWNHLSSNKINEGQILRLKADSQTSAAPVEVAHNSPMEGKENCSESPAEIFKTYTVKKGDGLFSLARELKVTVAQLKDWNELSSEILKEGQVLKFVEAHEGTQTSIAKTEPTQAHGKVRKQHASSTELPKTYLVQKGDTLYSISKKFNHISLQQLIRLNNLKDKKIKPGQQLILG